MGPQRGTNPQGVVKVEAVVYALCHIPERNWLLVGTSEGRMHVIDLEGRKELHNLELHKAGIFDLRFHPTTGNIFSASGDGSIAVLQLDRLDRTERRSLAPGHKIRAIDFHPFIRKSPLPAGMETSGSIRWSGLKSVWSFRRTRFPLIAYAIIPRGIICSAEDGTPICVPGILQPGPRWQGFRRITTRSIPSHFAGPTQLCNRQPRQDHQDMGC